MVLTGKGGIIKQTQNKITCCHSYCRHPNNAIITTFTPPTMRTAMNLPQVFTSFANKIMHPSVLVALSSNPTTPFDSKVGCTLSTKDQNHPTDTDANPMAFLAQINFGQMPLFPTQEFCNFLLKITMIVSALTLTIQLTAQATKSSVMRICLMT